MSDVRTAARASTGSIYHHFGSKEEIARALFLEGVRDTQESSLRALVRHRSAEQGIRALVGSYLDWVEAHPKWAAFLLTMRHARFMDAGEEQLGGMNRESTEAARAWLDKRVANGELPNLDFSLFTAIVFGPARNFARRWLDERTRVSLKSAKAALGTAAFAGLVALRDAPAG